MAGKSLVVCSARVAISSRESKPTVFSGTETGLLPPRRDSEVRRCLATDTSRSRQVRSSFTSSCTRAPPPNGYKNRWHLAAIFWNSRPNFARHVFEAEFCTSEEAGGIRRFREKEGPALPSETPRPLGEYST